jgi:hypothetical protein
VTGPAGVVVADVSLPLLPALPQAVASNAITAATATAPYLALHDIVTPLGIVDDPILTLNLFENCLLDK